LPEAFFTEPIRARSAHRSLLIGLVLTFTGVALFFAVSHQDADGAWFALVPGAIGMAYLIYYFAAGRGEALAQRAAGKPSPAEGSTQAA
jgi:uncharacterized membrane protein HdeD (DUF308 family)